MRAVLAPLAGALALALTAVALVPASTEAQQSVTIALAPQGNSGQSGTAVLTPDGAGTKVVVTLSNAPGPHPAHIHSGSCPTPGAVVFPLTSVTNGRSETTVMASIADILKAPHAINVHKSPQEIPVYTACGNLTAAGTVATAAASAPAAQPSPAAKPAAPAAPAAKPAAPMAPAAQPSPAAKPAAPVQAPAAKPAAVPSPSALPRTGEADPTAGIWMVAAGGVALVGAGLLLLLRRRRSI